MWQQKGENQGIWTEYVNDKTGQTSLETHEPKTVKQWCAKNQHDFQIVDMGKRIAECTRCQQETHFIVGADEIDGNRVMIR